MLRRHHYAALAALSAVARPSPTLRATLSRRERGYERELSRQLLVDLQLLAEAFLEAAGVGVFDLVEQLAVIGVEQLGDVFAFFCVKSGIGSLPSPD